MVSWYGFYYYYYYFLISFLLLLAGGFLQILNVILVSFWDYTMIWISNIQYYKWFLTEIDTLPSWTKIVWTLILIRTRIVVNLWSKFFFFFFVVVDTCRVILKHDSLDLIWIRFNWMGLYVTHFHFSMKYHGLNRHVLWAHLFVCLNDNKQMIRFVVFLCFLPRVLFCGRST